MRRSITIILIIMIIPVLGLAEEDSELDIEELWRRIFEEDAEAELDIEEMRRRIFGEAPGELMSYSIGDSEVSLFLTGSWMGSLQGNLGFSVSPLGAAFAAPETPLLFKQEVDLSLSLWINDRWFVEANFQDDYSLNTYSAGYQGLSGEFLQYAGIGNTGLDFPVFPYLDLGGDSLSSFGFYSRFGNNDFTFHALLRYDAASREERIFSGGRERTFSDVSPQTFIRGISFVLPDINIASQIIVFIEDENGNIVDNSARRWRHAAASEYAVSYSEGLLELSIRPVGMVAIAYTNGDTPWDLSLGNYNNNDDSFLSRVQQWFDQINIDLRQYPQCGNRTSSSGRPGEVIFGITRALVIYEPGTFSPFERLNRYHAPSSTSERAALVQLSTGTAINGFDLVRQEDATSLDRNIYELVNLSFSSNRRSEASRWPLAKSFPEIYLPPVNVFPGDIALRFTNLSGSTGYFIGTDVIPGSVQVFRSGIQDSNFSYNPESGEVSIRGNVGENEIIRITYLKTSEGMRFGSIAAGFGAIYNNSVSPFSAQAAVGIRWNLTDDVFTDEYMASEGSVGISAKAAWDYDFFNAHVTAGLAFVQTDTTGLFRVAGMDGHEIVLPLTPASSFISNPSGNYNLSDRADLIFRNYFNNNILGSNLMTIEWSAPLVSGMYDRPYPARDSLLGDTQVLVAEFELNSAHNWTGFQVPLGAYSENLSRAVEIEIPFRLYDFDPAMFPNLRLIVQIGSLSGRDFPFIENSELIWEETLFPIVDSIGYDAGARIGIERFVLDDEDRRKLGDAKYLRLIVVNDDNTTVRGRVLLAPPIVRGSTFRAITVESGNVNGIPDSVTASETRESILTTGNYLENDYPDIIRRLHPVTNTQRVLRIDWDNINSGVSVGVDGRMGEIPLADYRELSFFVKGPQSESSINLNNRYLHFIIAPGPDSINNPQLHARIPLAAFDPLEWRKVTIRYQGNNTGVTVDRSSVQGEIVRYSPLSSSIGDFRRTNYIAILIDPDLSSISETIYIDEIILEDPLMVYRMNAGAFVEYSRPGILLSLGATPVLADFSITSSLESEARARSGLEESPFTGSMLNRTGIGISVFGANVTGNLDFTVAQDTFLWSADHSISRTFGDFSVRETFFASPQTNTARHGVNFAYLSDLQVRFDADALYDLSRLRQRWNLGMGYRPQNVLIPSVTFNTEAVWTMYEQIDEDENYASLWLRTFVPLIPDFGSDADSRRTQTSIILTQRTRPVGAILNLQGSTGFTGANNITRSENSVFLDIPVILDRTRLNFRAGRGFRRHIYFSGDNVLDDGEKFFESISDSLPLWGVFPGYSLFAEGLNDAMDRALSGSPSAEYAFFTSFSDHFNARITLPPVYTISSLFIPSRINFRVDRLLEQRMDTRTDRLTVAGGLGFSAINLFGALGISPIFDFFQTDEYSHSIEASFIFPRNEDVSWRIQSVFGAGFRGFTGGELDFTNTLSIRSGGNWTQSFVASWETPTERSLLSVFYDWATSSLIRQNFLPGISSLFNASYEQLRRESLEIILDKSTDYMRWTIVAGHEEIIRILGRLNFSTFVKLRLNNDMRTETFTLDAQLGTTLRIMF